MDSAASPPLCVNDAGPGQEHFATFIWENPAGECSVGEERRIKPEEEEKNASIKWGSLSKAAVCRGGAQRRHLVKFWGRGRGEGKDGHHRPRSPNGAALTHGKHIPIWMFCLTCESSLFPLQNIQNQANDSFVSVSACSRDRHKRSWSRKRNTV